MIQRLEKVILLVDDDPLILDVMTVVLRQSAFIVHAFVNGADAVAFLKIHAEDIDLLITDHSMPEMTGYELVRECHAICPVLPVLLISGYAGTFDSTRMTVLGICGLLCKPIRKSELLEAVRIALVAQAVCAIYAGF